jgi:hypothetical protein
MALSIANDLRFSISVAFWEAITSLSKFFIFFAKSDFEKLKGIRMWVALRPLTWQKLKSFSLNGSVNFLTRILKKKNQF